APSNYALHQTWSRKLQRPECVTTSRGSKPVSLYPLGGERSSHDRVREQPEMKKRAGLITVFFCGLFAGSGLLLLASPSLLHRQPTATCPWPDSLDAVRAAPENHRVLLETERVRVLDVTIPAGLK